MWSYKSQPGLCTGLLLYLGESSSCILNSKIIKKRNSLWKVNWSTWHKRGPKKKVWVKDRSGSDDLPPCAREVMGSPYCQEIRPLTQVRAMSHFITELKIHHLYSLIRNILSQISKQELLATQFIHSSMKMNKIEWLNNSYSSNIRTFHLTFEHC